MSSYIQKLSILASISKPQRPFHCLQQAKEQYRWRFKISDLKHFGFDIATSNNVQKISIQASIKAIKLLFLKSVTHDPRISNTSRYVVNLSIMASNGGRRGCFIASLSSKSNFEAASEICDPKTCGLIYIKQYTEFIILAYIGSRRGRFTASKRSKSNSEANFEINDPIWRLKRL